MFAPVKLDCPGGFDVLPGGSVPLDCEADTLMEIPKEFDDVVVEGKLNDGLC